MNPFYSKLEKTSSDPFWKKTSLIITILENYKKNTLQYYEKIDNELIKVCLENNTDPTIRQQLNLFMYVGPLILNV